jgi:hypothetical protein
LAEPRASKTACESGAATGASANDAVKAAIGSARQKLGSNTPHLGMLFVSARHSLKEALAAARRELPDTDFLGCTSAGEITDAGLTRGGVALMLIAWGDASHTTAIVDPGNTDTADLATELCKVTETARGRNHACVLLGDGLSPTFEKVVVRMLRSQDHHIVGGGAADDWEFKQTAVGLNDQVHAGGMAAANVLSVNPWSVGVEHGLRPVTPRMTITKAIGNVVHTIDDRPALDVYRDYARSRGANIEGEARSQFLVENELGVLLFEDVVRVRAALRDEPDGALFFAGEVPEGSSVCIVRGDHDEIISAARSAAEAARDGLRGVRAAGILVFSCVCRARVLGDRYAAEIDAIRAIFPDAPIAGFSSYGEVARTSSKLDGYHNNTIVVAAIPE